MRIVVGPDDPRTTSGKVAQHAQQRAFVNALRQAGIKFQVDQVIELTNIEVTNATPGQFRKAYTALVCARIPVLASYSGESIAANAVESEFFQVPAKQIKQALAILCHFDLANPEQDLCINLGNVEQVCRKHARAQPQIRQVRKPKTNNSHAK